MKSGQANQPINEANPDERDPPKPQSTLTLTFFVLAGPKSEFEFETALVFSVKHLGEIKSLVSYNLTPNFFLGSYLSLFPVDQNSNEIRSNQSVHQTRSRRRIRFLFRADRSESATDSASELEIEFELWESRGLLVLCSSPFTSFNNDHGQYPNQLHEMGPSIFSQLSIKRAKAIGKIMRIKKLKINIKMVETET